MALNCSGQIMIFGGFSDKGEKYHSNIMVLDTEKREWSINKQKLKLGDMFYYG